jgi:hypothetical protein
MGDVPVRAESSLPTETELREKGALRLEMNHILSTLIWNRAAPPGDPSGHFNRVTNTILMPK